MRTYTTPSLEACGTVTMKTLGGFLAGIETVAPTNRKPKQ